MKKILFLCTIWLAAFPLLAQTTDAQLNYVQKTTVRKADVKNETDLQLLTPTQKAVTTEFADTWGRKLQTVQHHASPTGNDIVQPYYYDPLGRPTLQYLPYTVIGTEGQRYRPNAIVNGHPATTTGMSEQQAFYAVQNIVDNQYPYVQVEFDNSPLNQVVGQSKIGTRPYYTNYIGNNTVIETNKQQATYLRSNKSATATQLDKREKVRQWFYNPITQQFDGTAYCQANTLLVEINQDERLYNTNYKDGRGRIILNRKNYYGFSYANEEYFTDTYSIYNDLDQLIAVIQPEGVKELANRVDVNERWKFAKNDAFFKKFVFFYEYDDKGQLVAKTVPDKERQQFFYDDLGRLIAAQVAPSTTLDGYYVFTYKKYDSWGREIMAGTFEADPANLEAVFKNGMVAVGFALYENKQYDSQTLLPYTNDNAFPRSTDNREARISNLQVLQINYYDDYRPQQDGSTVNTWFYAQTAPFIDGLQPYTRIKGKPTFGLTKILNEGYGTDLRKDWWEFTVTFYDEYGHSIQTQNYELQWGEGTATIWETAKQQTANAKYDIATSLYDAYRGELLKTQVQHRYPESTNKEYITVQNRYLYDPTGRLTHTYQQHIVGGQLMPEVLVAKNSYNEVEKNVKTLLHSTNIAPQAPITDFVQDIDYTYNLEGQIYKINNTAQVLNHQKLFALDYRYRFELEPWENAFFNDVDGYCTNGMPTHTAWKSFRDSKLKGFTYNYGVDGLFRITRASYANNILPVWGTDYTVISKSFNTSYDLNGNITQMQRVNGDVSWWSPITNINDVVDDLTYTYVGNQLKQVREDAIGIYKNYSPNTGNDFRVRGTTPNPADDQYWYDSNGNMVRDVNKGIWLNYNYLQLPDNIVFEDRSTIKFTYNAAGERLRQVAPNKRTDYVNGFVYEDGRLKSFGLPHGQMVNVPQKSGGYALEYEYHYTDHQGNLRLAFRVRSNKTEYDLTAENKVRSAEDKNFADDGSKQQGGYTDEVRTNLVAFTGNYSVALKQGGRGTQTHRIFKKIPIKAGTKLSMAVVAKYIPLDKEGVVSLQSATTKKSDLATLSAVAAPLLSLSTQQIGTEAAPTPVANLNVLAVVPFIKKLFSKPTPVVTESPTILFSGSMAGMRFRFDDKNGSYTHSHVSSLSTARPTEWTQLGLSYVAADDGVLEVEIFNYNTDLPVFFDDWHIELTEDSKPEIVQEVHYDPWGLVMEDESYFASVSPANGADLFNGKELQTYADLNFYDYHWRQYDPQLGRWHSPDPADQFYGISGYAYCANNPVMLTDPDGREIVLGTILIAAAIGGIINTATHWGQITAGGGFNWGAAGVAFGIGAGAGALSVVTGGAAAGALSVSTSSMLGGAIAGVVGAGVSSPLQALGNWVAFGDSYSWGKFGFDVLIGGAVGSIMGAYAGWRNFKKNPADDASWFDIIFKKQDKNVVLPGEATIAKNQEPDGWDLNFAENTKKMRGNSTNQIGEQYEKFLQSRLGGRGGFKSGGVQFDGAFDNVWYEAKAGGFWNNVALKDVAKWKSKFGHYLSIAGQNGNSFHVYSENAIPQVFKDYFTKKGIQFFENFK